MGWIREEKERTRSVFEEASLHLLADKHGMDRTAVRRLYNIVGEHLGRNARIKDYLPVLVDKRVRYLVGKKKRPADNG